MKKILSSSLLIFGVFYSQTLHATSPINITSPSTSIFSLTGDSQTVNITGSGNVTAATSSVGVLDGTGYFNATININTTSASDGITATGDTYGAIWFNGGSLDTLTLTSGTLTSKVVASQKGTVYLSVDSGDSTIIVGQDSGGSATISNTGSNGTENGAAIASENYIATDLTINNKATGTISASGIGSYAISLVDSGAASSLTLTNAGTISAASSSSTAIELSGFSGNITNSGTITGGISSDTNLALNLTNSGTINGLISLGRAAGSSFTLNSGSVTGTISMQNSSQTTTINGGTLTGNIAGSLDHTGNVVIATNFTSNGNFGFGSEGNVRTLSSVSVSANNTLDMSINNNSINSDSISLATGSTLKMGSGTITAANLTINSGSSLGLLLSNPSATSISLTGAATVSSGAKLNLTLPNTIAPGTVVTVIDASSSSSINAVSSSNININSSGGNTYGLSTFTTSVSGNKLLLTTTAVPTPTLASANDQGAYNALSQASSNGTLATVQNYLGNSSVSNAQKSEVVKSVTAQVDNSTNRVAFNNVATTSGIVSARLESVRTNNFNASIVDASFANNLFNQPSVASSAALSPLRDNNLKPSFPAFITLKGDDALSRSAMWIQTFGSKIAQGNTSAGDGYNANSGGVMIGADRHLSKDFVVGLSSGYSKSNISARNAFKSTGIETYQAGIYTGYDAKSYFLNTTLGVSVSNYTSDRYISVANASAKAAYSGMGYTARAELGKNYTFNDDVLFTPSFAITAARNEVNAYDESGAGTLNLHVKTDSTNFFEGRLGVDLSKLVTTKSGTQMRPHFSTSYGYDFAANKQKSTSNFIGQTSSFSSTGAKVAQGSLMLGTGVSFYTKKDVTVSVNYGFEHRSDYISHSGWLRMGYKF